MKLELETAEALARAAGELLLGHVRRGVSVEEKTPDDPVTAADREASELIVAGLRRVFPEDGILSEELTDSEERLSRRRVWIVDPIDGTREFVTGTGDYAVSIGLAVDGEPVLGVVCAPHHGDVYSGVVGLGVWKNGSVGGFSPRPLADALIAVSDTEHARELHAYPVAGMMPSGSIAYKLAKIAAGEVDATFTINPRAEWDIAAGHALVRAAGGDLTTRDGQAIRYNRPTPILRRGIVGGRPEVVAWLRETLSAVGMPEQQLYVRDTDEVWSLLPEGDARGLASHPHLHVRHAGGKIEALVALRQGAQGDSWEITRAEGDANALRTLIKDLQRGYGALSDPTSR